MSFEIRSSMPSPSVSPVKKRPKYLVVALIAAWIIGTGGVMGGCAVVQFFHNPAASSVQVHAPEHNGDDFASLIAQQRIISKQASDRAMLQYQRRMLPLGLANVLLSGLLIVAAVRALNRRYGSLPLALQAVVANAALLVVDYVLSAPVRKATFDAIATQHIALANTSASDQSVDLASLTTAMNLTMHASFALQLLTLSLIAYALTRPKVIQYFQSIPPPQTTEQ